MQYWTARLLALFLIFGLQSTQANSTLIHQKSAQAFIQELVKKDHFDRRQVETILTNATFQPQIIASMERPYEKKDWDIYRDVFLTQERLNGGLQFWKQNRQALLKAEREYGVPAEVIVAIVGVETLYGKRQGNYRVLDALTTLAFYYPARAEYFKRELREFLLLCREHGVPATQYMGSYAGAMGKPQFMPSSYRTFAVGYQGQNRPNLMNEDRDVITSVANYFKKHGWQSHQMVVEKARVTPQAIQQVTLNSRSPNYPFIALLKAGVTPEASVRYHPHEAGLLELTTAIGPEYWLAYHNFYVITKYNTSPQYALVVHLLAQSLRQHYDSHTV